jgi:hypothetical protein
MVTSIPCNIVANKAVTRMTAANIGMKRRRAVAPLRTRTTLSLINCRPKKPPMLTRSQNRRLLGLNNRGLVNGGTRRPLRTERETWWRRSAVLALGTAGLLSITGCANQSAVSLEGKPLSGYVRMTQVQAAYLGSGNAGGGVLKYKGSTYPFSVGGLGVGGIGVSKIEARGEVYGLQRLDDFAGAYAQARYIRDQLPR